MGPDKQNAITNYRHDDKRPKATKAYGELGPMADLVYIKPELNEGGETKSGIILVKPKHQGAPVMGEVLAVGKNIKLIQVGDRVVFNDPNARGFWLNDIAHIPLKEEQIIAIMGDSRRASRKIAKT